MTTNQFLQDTNDVLRGTDDDAPLIGSDEANYWLRTANRIRRTLYRDTSKQWGSTYDVAELGTVSAATAPTFDLDDTFLSPATSAYVINGDYRTDLDIIKPQEQDSRLQAVYIAGQDPEVLYFSKEILTADNMVGGTLYLPGYFMPDDISTNSGTAQIIVDDTDWLVTATAAELAFNDITYENKAADLNGRANALFSTMVKNNRRTSYGNHRTTPYEVKRIGSRTR